VAGDTSQKTEAPTPKRIKEGAREGPDREVARTSRPGGMFVSVVLLQMPAGRNSMSPWPRRVSAPPWSRITRESTCEETANAIRDGMFTLIVPVMMSVEGRWVASSRWMPTARAFWASRMIASSTSAGGDHHQVGKLVDHAEDVWQRRLAVPLANLVELGDVAGPSLAHHGVAALHLGDQVVEHIGREAGAT